MPLVAPSIGESQCADNTCGTRLQFQTGGLHNENQKSEGPQEVHEDFREEDALATNRRFQIGGLYLEVCSTTSKEGDKMKAKKAGKGLKKGTKVLSKKTTRVFNPVDG